MNSLQQKLHLLIEGSKAQITLTEEDEWVIPVQIIKVIDHNQISCLDLAGRWRSPLIYPANQLSPINNSPSL